MAIAGRVAIVPKGDWSADATYKRLDAVTYNNTLYFAKKEVPAGTVTSNTEYWSKSIVGGVGTIAKPEEAGIVKPDGKSMSVDESGTLSINLDGTTITLDEAKNVIKLADTLKDAINGAFPAANVANNQITTVEGFALDARQANPNIDGSLAKQISDLNGSLNIVPIEVGKTSSKAVYNSYEFFRIGHIGWYNMWLTYSGIQEQGVLEEIIFKFPENIFVRYITGGACSTYGETTHGGIDGIIYSTEHTLSVRVSGAINTQIFSIYATGMFLIN